MAETLALIKQLHLRKIIVQQEINEFTKEKQDIEQQIEKLLFAPPHNRQRQPLREYSSRGPVSKFCTPSKISDELAEFLGKEKGTKMARTDVTREINKYIRINGLQDNENKRNINPDTKLSTLFKLKDGDELTYFNIQRHITHHFNDVI
jgi:chromatin remodeling complex protein RSC6